MHWPALLTSNKSAWFTTRASEKPARATRRKRPCWRTPRATEQHYRRALALCPPTALADLGPIHNQLGQIYRQVGQTEPAREHYEKCVQLAEQTGDRYHAGGTRFNMALMYLDAADRESAPARRRDLLLRARAYAQAALRDYQHYQGRAAADEADAQRLLAEIAEGLAG